MKKILLVKTSSLGDVVHNLPVVSDIARRYPGARIDWVVEEGFAALPALHPAVARVIPVAVRRWRKTPLGRDTWREVGAVRKLFAAEPYDVVIDTQGLVKSALIARSAKGERHGYNARSAREALAARFYDVTHAVPRHLHAVARNRALAAAALRYRIDDGVDYGLGVGAKDICGEDGESYCVLLHATSRADKHWAEARWTDLGARLAKTGLQCILPWGSASELVAAERLATAIPGARVAPRLDLTAMAGLLAGARCVVGVDTGLTHLSAALGRPTVAIFCASSSALTGVYGAVAACNLGAPGAPPGVGEVLTALGSVWPGRLA
jgi:heptosyltransferase-1